MYFSTCQKITLFFTPSRLFAYLDFRVVKKKKEKINFILIASLLTLYNWSGMDPGTNKSKTVALCLSSHLIFLYIRWLCSYVLVPILYFSTSCGCGVLYQNYGQADDRECGPCPGNNTQYCGGLARTSVYKLAGTKGRIGQHLGTQICN